jgi:hypothetical protein
VGKNCRFSSLLGYKHFQNREAAYFSVEPRYLVVKLRKAAQMG